MKTNSPVEKKLAQKAQKALTELIFGKIVYLTDVGMDKYGRVLANVYLEQINLSQWMLDNGHAVQYNGGTKKIPDEWKKI
jgi:endonuclease YncB( thermonuclease family)